MFISRIVRQSFLLDWDQESHRDGFNRIGAFLGYWFAILESAIVMGAIWVAAESLRSPLLVAIYGISYVALSLYILMGARYLLSLAPSIWNWARTAASLIVSLSIPYVLPSLVAEIIRAGIK